MSCGVCSPEAFRSKPAAQVWGYLTASETHHATADARRLYFMGAEVVFSDSPDAALEDRPGWKRLSDPAFLRDGDRLILSKLEDLDADPETAEAHIEALAKRGIETCILNPEYFEGDQYAHAREAAE